MVAKNQERIKKIKGNFNAHYNPNGIPDYRIPVALPDSLDGDPGEMRGLTCKDFGKLKQKNVTRACSTSLGYVPIENGSVPKFPQPGNAPLGIATIDGTQVAFVLGRYACPQSCGDLDYTQTFGDALVKVDPVSKKVSLGTSVGWKEFDDMEALRADNAWKDLFTGYVGSLEEVWPTLQQLYDSRTEFSRLKAGDRADSDRDFWENASLRDLPDIQNTVAKKVESAMAVSIENDVKCSEAGNLPPADGYENRERIPSDPNNPPESTTIDIQRPPGECRVTTVAEGPDGEFAESAVVPRSDVARTLSQQETKLAALAGANNDRVLLTALSSRTNPADNTQRLVKAAIA